MIGSDSTKHIKVCPTFYFAQITSKPLLTAVKHGINAHAKPPLLARNDKR